jgi:hypothetical protein
MPPLGSSADVKCNQDACKDQELTHVPQRSRHLARDWRIILNKNNGRPDLSLAAD